MSKPILLLISFFIAGTLAAQNPNVILPEGTYPY